MLHRLSTYAIIGLLLLTVSCSSNASSSQHPETEPLSTASPELSSIEDQPLMLSTDECSTLSTQAMLELQNNNPQQAWLILQTARDGACASAEIHAGFGVLYDQMQEHDKAFAAFDYALATDPSFAYAYNNRGRVYAMIGLSKDALTDFQQTIALQPQNARAHFNIGGILAAHNQFDQALQSFIAADALNYSPASQAIEQVKTEMAGSETSSPSAVSNITDSEDVLLSHAMLRLSRFAYAKMGPDRRLEASEGKQILGFGSKSKIDTTIKWSTAIEDLHGFDKDGYDSSTLGVTLEITQAPTFLVRVTIPDDEIYQLSLWTVMNIDGFNEEAFEQSKTHDYSIDPVQLESFLDSLISDGILTMHDGILTFNDK